MMWMCAVQSCKDEIIVSVISLILPSSAVLALVRTYNIAGPALACDMTSRLSGGRRLPRL